MQSITSPADARDRSPMAAKRPRADAQIAHPLAVVVDHGAALEDEIVGFGHFRALLRELPIGTAGACHRALSAYVLRRVLARDQSQEGIRVFRNARQRSSPTVAWSRSTGDDARRFLNGLATNDIGKVAPDTPRFAALLTPQGKIIVDFIVVEAPAEDGGGFLLDCPRALAGELAKKLNFYKLRAKVTVEDLSETLGVMAVWDGTGTTQRGLCYPDPRLAALGMRVMLPPQHAAPRRPPISAPRSPTRLPMTRIASRSACRAAAQDFAYGDAFPHEADMDQLTGVDFDKGCYVGQEVVSRVEHRNSARSRDRAGRL